MEMENIARHPPPRPAPPPNKCHCIAVINTVTKNNTGEASAYLADRLQSVVEGSQGRNLA